MGREKWGEEWKAYFGSYERSSGDMRFRGGRGKKPLTLIFPGDFDQAQAVIEHLYHPEEAAAIIAALTP